MPHKSLEEYTSTYTIQRIVDIKLPQILENVWQKETTRFSEIFIILDLIDS